MINKKKLNYIINQIEETNLISFNFLILFLSFSIVPPLKMARWNDRNLIVGEEKFASMGTIIMKVWETKARPVRVSNIDVTYKRDT